MVGDQINVECFLTFQEINGRIFTSLEIRQKNEKIQEIALANTPVVLRSEADELYETIYELRKRVHPLEKQLGASTPAPEQKESKASSKKKATA